jgi:uncharacterized integral membrane protein
MSSDSKSTPPRERDYTSGQVEQQRTWTAKRVAAGVIAAFVLLFALVNTRSVQVSWILGSPIKTPLIVVIVLTLAIGIAIGYLFAKFRGRGRSLRE